MSETAYFHSTTVQRHNMLEKKKFLLLVTEARLRNSQVRRLSLILGSLVEPLCPSEQPQQRHSPEKIRHGLVQGERVAIAPAVLASIYYGLGAVAQEKLGPGQCNAEFPVHYFYAWLDQYFPKLYMRLPLPDLGKLKDYVPEMLAIENIEAGKFDAKMARLFICHPMSFTWRPYKHGIVEMP